MIFLKVQEGDSSISSVSTIRNIWGIREIRGKTGGVDYYTLFLMILWDCTRKSNGALYIHLIYGQRIFQYFSVQLSVFLYTQWKPLTVLINLMWTFLRSHDKRGPAEQQQCMENIDFVFVLCVSAAESNRGKGFSQTSAPAGHRACCSVSHAPDWWGLVNYFWIKHFVSHISIAFLTLWWNSFISLLLQITWTTSPLTPRSMKTPKVR